VTKKLLKKVRDWMNSKSDDVPLEEALTIHQTVFCRRLLDCFVVDAVTIHGALPVSVTQDLSVFTP